VSLGCVKATTSGSGFADNTAMSTSEPSAGATSSCQERPFDCSFASMVSTSDFPFVNVFASAPTRCHCVEPRSDSTDANATAEAGTSFAASPASVAPLAVPAGDEPQP